MQCAQKKIKTHQVESGSEDGGIGDGSRLAAVQEKLEAFHSLTDGAQIHHVLVLHGFLAGCETLLEAMRTWRRRSREEEEREEKRGGIAGK